MEDKVETISTPSSKDLNLEARAYFLNQGQSVNKLNDMLEAGRFGYHFKTGVSMLLEVFLYLLFTTVIIIVAVIPGNPLEINYNLSQEVEASFSMNVEDISIIILLIKCIIVLIALPIFGMAILLRRNRRKSRLINKAYSESDQMKTAFYRAVNVLKL